jgi:hypothetical protein
VKEKTGRSGTFSLGDDVVGPNISGHIASLLQSESSDALWKNLFLF